MGRGDVFGAGQFAKHFFQPQAKLVRQKMMYQQFVAVVYGAAALTDDIDIVQQRSECRTYESILSARVERKGDAGLRDSANCLGRVIGQNCSAYGDQGAINVAKDQLRHGVCGLIVCFCCHKNSACRQNGDILYHIRNFGR